MIKSIARITVNGVDVTRWCYGFNTDRGEAWCYWHDGQNFIFDANGELLPVVLRGRIDVEAMTE